MVALVYYMLGHVKKEVIFKESGKKEAIQTYDSEFLSAYKQIRTLYSFRQFEAASKKLDELKDRSNLSEKEIYVVYLLEAIINRAKGLRSSALDSLKKARNYGDSKWGNLLEGIVNLELDDKVKAESAFLRAVKIEKGYSYGYEQLGDMRFMDEEYAEALSYYKKNADYGRNGLIKAAMTEFFLKNYKDSLKHLKGAREFFSAKDYPAMGYLFEAFNEEALDNDVDADRSYARATSASKVQERDFYQYFYSLYLMKKKEEDKALDLLNRVIATSEDLSDEARILAAKYLYSKKDYRASYNQFRTVYLRHKENEELSLFYGFSLFQISNPNGALDIANEVIEKSSKEKNVVLAHLLRSMAYLKLKHFDKTIETIDYVKRQFGQDVQFINMLGYTVLSSFDDKDTEIIFNYIINHNEAGEYDDILADYFLLRKRYNPALSIYLNKGLRDNKNVVYLKNAADVLLKVGDIKRSKDYYQKALNVLGGKNAEAAPLLNNLAYIHYRENDKESFLRTLEQALKLSSNNPMLYYNMAMFYKTSNENLYKSNLFRADSIVNLNAKFWEKRKEASKIYYELGMVYRSESDTKMANEAFQKALKIDKNNNLAAYRLKRK